MAVISNSSPLIALTQLLAAKDRGFLNKIRPELDRLLAVRFFLDQELYDRAIGQAGE